MHHYMKTSAGKQAAAAADPNVGVSFNSYFLSVI